MKPIDKLAAHSAWVLRKRADRKRAENWDRFNSLLGEAFVLAGIVALFMLILWVV